MNIFNLSEEKMKETFSSYTIHEIYQQPATWRKTCAQLAERMGRTGSHRAVGAAVRANPLAIIVPAHRVTSANGKPLGTGRPAAVKGALLKMEMDNLAK